MDRYPHYARRIPGGRISTHKRLEVRSSLSEKIKPITRVETNTYGDN